MWNEFKYFVSNSLPVTFLVLLDRVFLRLGNANTDDQLESCLSRFLPPVILKLSSPHEQVTKLYLYIAETILRHNLVN